MFVVFFEDDGAAADQRSIHMQAHLTFLERNADRIKAAGPVSDPRSSLPAGGLWTVDCKDEEDVWDLVKSDPFWPTGLRKSVTVHRWHRVFADGIRQADS
ncbi:hypothetical protein EOI86_09635 [Hwanghaeella grinnelliae]|uniref:YCII-related domain-containing protein n=1 Tax=Hwanghaeella grinnelliae TaxID=2500179 RepID=A0A437QYC1_9PROT|nr:YciI family protein [Hwanghaeella grinnelliae]RVU39472.1 hypothetical protein EOI86_09635 [Hwanghaeella grinnelliae]